MGLLYHYYVTASILCRHCLEVQKIDSLKEKINNLLVQKENQYINNAKATFTQTTYTTFSRDYQSLLSQISAILDFCNLLGFEAIEQGFDVRMPTTNDFNEFAENIDKLKKILSQSPYINSIESEQIRVAKVDIGSFYLIFAVIGVVGGVSTILYNWSKIVDKAIKIKSHILTCKQQEEEVRKMSNKNDLLEKVMEVNNLIIDTKTKECVAELASELGEYKDGDAEARQEQCLKDLSDMMMKGMEIYASIDADQEIKDLFPKSDELARLPLPTKLLESGSEEE